MIYGIIPVGGKGTRLGLPYPKELLPLKNFNSYYPVCKLTVDNMLQSGCEKIYFIHGEETKSEIKNYFKEDIYFHINNKSEMFSKVITCFLDNISLNEEDIVLFGLPDSYYKTNLYLELVKMDGLVCGLFITNDFSKVDRLKLNSKIFDVKSEKLISNSSLFWGVIKFDYYSLKKYTEIITSSNDSEVGSIINKIGFE
jgi:hypothetical protein